tara:strand:+ start:4545 stop:4802 length:258 start_codon:yes stop_codon:yes gene_type:complete
MKMKNVREVMNLEEIQDALYTHLLNYHPECELAIIYEMGVGEIVEIAHDYELFGIDEEGRGPKMLVVSGYSVIQNYKLIIPSRIL